MMSIAIRYFTKPKKGNTKKLADAVSTALGIEALEVSQEATGTALSVPKSATPWEAPIEAVPELRHACIKSPRPKWDRKNRPRPLKK